MAGMTYAKAGVNIDKANEAVKRIKAHVRKTKNSNVLSDVGAFGGMMKLPKGYKEPILVASTDGVGTKIKLAFLTGKHNTIGQDLVNHCTNDILVQGATPLFFLDYIGVGKLEPKVIEQIVKGLSKACKENSCALIGGETAEMPGVYKKGDYDLASCIVGVVERKKIITGKKIRPGNVLIALPSTGLHTNGFSLALKVLEKKISGKKSQTKEGKKLINQLMKVHKSYLTPIKKLLKKIDVNGMAHITGGGLVENIPRILPDNCGVTIERASWKIPSLFRLIQEEGKISDEEMFRAFNMGVGYIVIVKKKDVPTALKTMKGSWVIGDVVEYSEPKTHGSKKKTTMTNATKTKKKEKK